MSLKRKRLEKSKPEKLLKQSNMTLEHNFSISQFSLTDDDLKSSLDVSICTVTDSELSIEDFLQFKPDVDIRIESDSKSLEEQSNFLLQQLLKSFEIVKVIGDGNCFFRAVLKATGNNESEHLYLRKSVTDFMQRNPFLFQNEYVTNEYIMEYSNRLKAEGIWADSLIIHATSLYLETCIEIYIPGYSKPIKVNENSCSTIFLLNSDRNHFEILMSKHFDDNEEKLVIDLKSLKDMQLKKKFLMKKNESIMLDIKKVCPNSFKFPTNGKSIYQSIYDYYCFGTLPVEIENIPRTERTKSGRIKRTQSISNFTKTCRRYCIATNRENEFSMSRLIFFAEKSGCRYTIPYEDEIKSLIHHFHRATSNHYPSSITKTKIKDAGIFWIGMNERICKELLTCACKLIFPNKSTSKVVKKYQRIISQAPYERFQTDTADVSAEIQNGIISGKILGWTTNCVLLMVKDHFAKYLWSFLIPAKDAKSVARCLKTIFDDGHIPKMLHSDNGGEFKGEVKKLLSKFGIKHVKEGHIILNVKGSLKTAIGM